MEKVKNLNELKKTIEKCHTALKGDKINKGSIPHIRDWVVLEKGNKYHIGFSKFVCYKDMNADTYNKSYSSNKGRSYNKVISELIEKTKSSRRNFSEKEINEIYLTIKKLTGKTKSSRSRITYVEGKNIYWDIKNNPHSIFTEDEKNDISPEDQKFIEGEMAEKTVFVRKRNKKVVTECKKRDRYSCIVCGFHYNNEIVEAHHLKELSKTGKTKVCVDDLITLCPTCHSIAHMLVRRKIKNIENREILKEEIKKIILIAQTKK